MEATWVSIDGWIDKEDLVQIYKGILHSHEKEQNFAICDNVDGPRGYYATWNVRERHDLTYTGSLKNKINKMETNS